MPVVFSPYDIAQALGVTYAQALIWVKSGVIRGRRSSEGRWWVKRRQLRFALATEPQIAKAIAEAARARLLATGSTE